MTLLVRIALMIEGQEDVTWEDWVALARGDSTTASAASAVYSPVPRSSDSPNARTSPPRAIATPRISRGRSGSSGRNNAASNAT